MERKQLVSRIGLLREQLGLTQRELAQLLAVTENTVANWERGRSGLDWFERVAKLCRLFGCTAEELIEYVSESALVEKPKQKPSLAELQKLVDIRQPPKSIPNLEQHSDSSTLESRR